MHLTRRMRLIWHKLWLIPLVGATADVVASEAAKLGGVTVPIPWLFSAIGVAGMLGAAVARAYSVPLIPEGLEGPDEALTRRSRILGERLGATPVRVFVSNLPKLRGKLDTYLDGHDLFVSERVAELPEAERDFVLARALAPRGPLGRLWAGIWGFMALWGAVVTCLVAARFAFEVEEIRLPRILNMFIWLVVVVGGLSGLVLRMAKESRLGVKVEDTAADLGLAATGNLLAATSALRVLAETDAEKKQAVLDADTLEKWWDTKGKQAVEASEWYQRELAKASEINQMSSQNISGDSSIELPASETS